MMMMEDEEGNKRKTKMNFALKTVLEVEMEALWATKVSSVLIGF